jgi:predicted HicB family RNase H-like nuclease
VGEIKTLNIRLPKDLWAFVRKRAFDREMSINEFILRNLEKYKKHYEKHLTDNDNMVL